MKKLHPTLWRTCRVLSNENRLKLLWRLMQEGESSMGQLAKSVGMGEPSASMHLRALNSRGLIKAERRKLYVFYSVEANTEVEHASDLLEALRICHANGASYSQVVRNTTAFTHPRRISIVRVLSAGGMSTADLSMKTQISPQSLSRHLKKLVLREFVEKKGDLVCLKKQSHPLSKALLRAALH